MRAYTKSCCLFKQPCFTSILNICRFRQHKLPHLTRITHDAQLSPMEVVLIDHNWADLFDAVKRRYLAIGLAPGHGFALRRFQTVKPSKSYYPIPPPLGSDQHRPPWPAPYPAAPFRPEYLLHITPLATPHTQVTPWSKAESIKPVSLAVTPLNHSEE